MAGPTLTILGCGNLGTAVLKGILAAKTRAAEKPKSDSSASSSSSFTPPSRFIACVHRHESVARVQRELGDTAAEGHDVTVLAGENARGVAEADVIVLACEPRGLAEVLGPADVRERLRGGKLLVSILAGVTVEQILQAAGNPGAADCTVARVLPNTSAGIGQSMTAFAVDSGPGTGGGDDDDGRALTAGHRAAVRWVFGCVGEVVEVPTRLMDVSTALSGSGTAFAALLLEALAQGGLAMGLGAREAQLMAAQVMKGTAQQVLDGSHPAVLRDRVTTPGGCTIAGLCVMEEAGVRGAVSRAVREATTVVGMLGRGVRQPNRTKFD